MEFAVYSPAHNASAFVLTPPCMHPTLETERRLGPLVRKALVHVDSVLVESMAESHRHAAEFVISALYARSYVGRLVAASARTA